MPDKTDTELLDWLQQNQAIISFIPTGMGNTGPNGENWHVCCSGADPFGRENRHYYGLDLRHTINNAIEGEVMWQRLNGDMNKVLGRGH